MLIALEFLKLFSYSNFTGNAANWLARIGEHNIEDDEHEEAEIERIIVHPLTTGM